MSAPKAASAPFSRRSALALVLFGALVFVALLWMIGTGYADNTNDGGGHADGRGLNGYAALADYFDRRGYDVRRARTKLSLHQPGLLVLTPNAATAGKDIERMVAEHRRFGPVLVVTPKWAAAPAVAPGTKARSGWVRLVGFGPPEWPGFLDELTVNPTSAKPGGSIGWQAYGVAGTFPDSRLTMSGAGPGLVPLVTGRDTRIYAAYIDDGEFPRLATLASRPHDAATRDRSQRYPLIVVFDPDLLDNYGMSQLPSAQLADMLVGAVADEGAPITFDLTLNGLARGTNLLTLAFTPPFLAATLCLLLAAACVGWRAFLRFGPARAPERTIAFGKRALVANVAGLIRRANRLHLLGAPYAEAARQRLARAFALPRGADAADEFVTIDRAARVQGQGDHAFSDISARLTQARSGPALVKAARDLHALERTLKR